MSDDDSRLFVTELEYEYSNFKYISQTKKVQTPLVTLNESYQKRCCICRNYKLQGGYYS